MVKAGKTELGPEQELRERVAVPWPESADLKPHGRARKPTPKSGR